MNRAFKFIKREPMLCVSLLAAGAGLIITPPRAGFAANIDWRTLGNLLMMLCVLEGFKRENILRPVENLAKKLKSMFALSLFLIFGVFFSSMFVTNDVSLIIFVPLTISLFRSAERERYILPVISMENIAAVRGSLLTPFGSPQNMFLYGQAEEISFRSFVLHMSPLAAMSAALLVLFTLVLYRKSLGEVIGFRFDGNDWDKDGRGRRTVYLLLFALVIIVIVTRTRLWWAALIVVAAAVFAADRSIFRRVDYVLIATFFCFFIFSSSVAGNPGISAFLGRSVSGREYWWAIGLSQIISNVPATIVLYPFSANHAALIYGADTAGLCSLIGSLASVINYRIYVREYPGGGGKFIKTFTLISWAFFIFVVLPGYFISKHWLF
jgi:Na+/H+ antiporter NhaD/arsenite permease-like protein